MIIKTEHDSDFLGRKYPCTITQFYGKDSIDCTDREDLNDLIQEVLFKKCLTFRNQVGTVIGFEINEVWMDDYFIVYVPETGKLEYELVNNQSFYDKIEKLNEIMCDERLTWEFDSDIGISSL